MDVLLRDLSAIALILGLYLLVRRHDASRTGDLLGAALLVGTSVGSVAQQSWWILGAGFALAAMTRLMRGQAAPV